MVPYLYHNGTSTLPLRHNRGEINGAFAEAALDFSLFRVGQAQRVPALALPVRGTISALRCGKIYRIYTNTGS
jgi:hypothetical protein